MGRGEDAINAFYASELRITGSQRSWFELWILGRWCWAGYGRLLSGHRRLFAAAWQTIVVLSLYVGVFKAFGYYQLSKDDFLWVLGAVSAFFGAAFLREHRDYVSKWNYLANLFNNVVQIPHSDVGYDQREHLLACLVWDILTMEMWAHRSFHVCVRDVICRAAFLLKGADSISHLERAVNSGIGMEEVKNLVSSYIEEKAPKKERKYAPLQTA
jgi:hypothetical protein